MKRSVVEKTVRLLLAIAFFASVALAQSRDYTIQVESAPSEAEARSSVANLRAQGLEAYLVKATIPGRGVFYRVRIGRYGSRAQAKARADQLLKAGAIKEFLITTYDAPSSDSIALGESKPAPPPSKSAKRTGDENGARANAGPVPAPETVKPDIEKPALASAKPASEPREEKKLPEAKPGPKDESEPGGARPRKATATRPRIVSKAAPAVVEAPVDVRINNENWRVVKRAAGIDENLRVVYFVDSMTGWIAGDDGIVYRTTDGGGNWKPLFSGAAADIRFIYFVDWNHGWMLGESGGKMGDEAGSENILFITTNGGRAWTRRPLPNVTSLHFTDAKNGWAVGRNATLLKTTDGGLEWSRIESVEKLIGAPLDSSYNFGFSDVYFTDAEHGWLIGNFYGRARTDIGGLIRTSDGGATWKRVPLTFQTQRDSGRFIPGSLRTVRFTDANTGSITGEMFDGGERFFFALHTRDGGQTWSQSRAPSRATHNTQFLDPANGWTAAFAPREGGDGAAVYDTTLMRTNDGGQSWRDDFIARGRRVRGVFFLSPARGWAVGDGGLILSYEEKEKSKAN